MRHLSSWVLLLLSPFTSCTHNEVTVETCIGGTASFKWDYKVPPFHAVEWHFGKTQIAETLEEHLSQDSLSIKDNYKSRFVLLEKDTVGFNLTNVTGHDNGDYKCILTLQSTDIPMEKKWTLNVTGCHQPKRESDEVELSTVSDSPGNVLPVDKAVVIVSIVSIGAIGVIVVVFWKKRKCFAEKRSVSLEAKTRSESHELMEDKSKSPVANGKVSHGLMKQEDKEV